MAFEDNEPVGATIDTGINGLTVARGSERIFVITELRRVGSGYLPTGIEFRWSSNNFAAPQGPWQFGIKLRTVRTDLPGSEDPVEQVLGWAYEPFTLSGVWDNKHAQRSAGGAQFAQNQWQAFEALVKRGNVCRISFEQVSVMGLITGAQFNYLRKGKIGYSFTLSPHKRFEGESVRPEVNPGNQVVNDPRTSVKLAREGLDALQAAQSRARAANLSSVQQTLSTGIFGEVNDLIDDCAVGITSAENTVEKEIMVAQNAANALNRGAQTMESVKTAAANLLSRLRTVESTTENATLTIVNTLQFESWLRDLGAQARMLVVRTESSRKDFALRAKSKPTALHRVRQGESLYTISTRYYGTPHAWRPIMRANNLTSTILQGGELLSIPQSPQSDSETVLPLPKGGTIRTR